MRPRVEAIGEQTSLADRKRRAGQRLMIGWTRDAVDDDLQRLVRELRPAAFVLFARNLGEPQQIRELTRELASLAVPADPVLIAVDHEGGRVQRIGEPATQWPPMAALGAIDDLALTADVARAMGRELRALGIDVALGPVADVAVDSANPGESAVGDRAFGGSPEAVARQVAAFVRALQETGVVATAKHFPGLGHATADPHRALPRIEVDPPELERCALPPFGAAVDAGVGLVMAAHAIVCAWDEEAPVTLSSRVVPRVLRGDLGFDGVVVSDDLEMGAMAGIGVEALARRTAAIDVLMVTDTAELQHALFRELVLAQEEDAAGDRVAIDAVARVERLRERFLLGRPAQPGLDAVGAPDHQALAQLVRARGL